jgi:threonine synthase
MNGYCCIACATTQAADFAGFVCPSCGGNLEVTYDYEAIRKEFVQDFDYSPFLPVSRLDAPFPLRVGRTPLVAATRLGQSLGLGNVYLKDETRNPSASTKDRATAVALRRARDVGAKTVAVASTGNAGSSLACLAAALDLHAVVFVPESAPVAKLTQALSFGATVLAVRGNYDDAFDLCLKASSEFGWFNRSTGRSRPDPGTNRGWQSAQWHMERLA